MTAPRLRHLPRLVARVLGGELPRVQRLQVVEGAIVLEGPEGQAPIRLELADPSWRIDPEGRIAWS